MITPATPDPTPTPADPYPAPAHPVEPRQVPLPEPMGVPSLPSELPSEGEPLGMPPDMPSEMPTSPTMPQPWGALDRLAGRGPTASGYRMPDAGGSRRDDHRGPPTIA